MSSFRKEIHRGRQADYIVNANKGSAYGDLSEIVQTNSVSVYLFYINILHYL